MQKNFLCLSDPPTLYLQLGVTRFFAKLLKKNTFIPEQYIINFLFVIISLQGLRLNKKKQNRFIKMCKECID